MVNIKKYFKIWWLLSTRSAQVAFVSRFGAIGFLLGKLIRFVFFLFFLFILIGQTQAIAGYNLWQIIFFYATFNLLDTLVQFFLREVYRFRWYVVSGDFDFFLVKPYSPLFRSLFGGADPLDIPMIALSIVFVVFSGIMMGGISLFGVAFYILLLANSMLLALSFHIFVLAVGVLTTEVDNTIWLYRDLTQMGRVPVDIYLQPLRAILTFAIPVGIMITFPAKALMGLLSFQGIIISIAVALLFFRLSISFWRFSLTRYASASS